MARISLACAVGAASLEPQWNANNRADQFQRSALHCHYTVQYTFQNRTHPYVSVAPNMPSDEIFQNKYFVHLLFPT